LKFEIKLNRVMSDEDQDNGIWHSVESVESVLTYRFLSTLLVTLKPFIIYLPKLFMINTTFTNDKAF
jgi:hypothetical protein